MLEILQYCNEFVPQCRRTAKDGGVEKKILHKVTFGGDHLTVECGVSAVASVADSDCPFERLEGLILKHEDFHCEMNVLQVSSFPICKIKSTGSSHKNCPNQCKILLFQMIFDYMFKSSSAGDLETLNQLKCKLNKKDVTEKVTKSYHGCEAFFSTVLHGYITYAVMEYFGMPSPHENPSKSIPSRHTGSDAHFFEEVGKKVDTFILQKVQPETLLLEDAPRKETTKQQPCYRCRYPGCDRTYTHEKRRDNHELSSHGMMIQEHIPVRSPPDPQNVDCIFNYAHNILKSGLLLRDFQDAIKEGDGARIEYI